MTLLDRKAIIVLLGCIFTSFSFFFPFFPLLFSLSVNELKASRYKVGCAVDILFSNFSRHHGSILKTMFVLNVLPKAYIKIMKCVDEVYEREGEREITERDRMIWTKPTYIPAEHHAEELSCSS